MKRGQLLIDFLVLVIALTFVFVFITSFVGERALNAQAVLYDSQIQEKTLLSVLNKEVVEANAGGQLVRGTIAELLWVDAEVSVIDNFAHNISDALNKSTPGRNYIFASTSGVVVADKQDQVCLDDISVANFEGEGYNVTYGSWFDWMDVPKEC